jgi:hypothetical protein
MNETPDQERARDVFFTRAGMGKPLIQLSNPIRLNPDETFVNAGPEGR